MKVYCEFARLVREKTGSYLTVKLPTVMTNDGANKWLTVTYPDWEVIHTSPANPD